MQIDQHIYVVEKRDRGLDAAGLGREFLRLTRGNQEWISERLDLLSLLSLAGNHWGLVVGPEGKNPRLPLIQACFPKVISVRCVLYTMFAGKWEEGSAAWKESRQIYPV